MNAAQKADSFETVSKIAAVVNLFRSQFPNALADLNPWIEDAGAAQYAAPNSLDLSFHVPRHSWMCQCRSILMEIQLEHDAVRNGASLNVQLSGHDCTGQQWYFSTEGNREFTGMIPPVPEAQDRLRFIGLQVLKLFPYSKTKQDIRRDCP